MLNGKGRVLGFIAVLSAMVILSGCVTVGEYERLKDELAQAQDTVGQRDRQLDELDAGKRVFEERALALAEELNRYRQHSAAADRKIEELTGQLAEKKKSMPTGVAKTGIAGLEVFQPDGSGDVGLRLSDEILFDSGSETLKAAGKTALDWVISNSLKASNGKIQVCGHTDSDPVVKTKAKWPGGNIQLSAHRAMAVQDYLRKHGISEKRISIAGFGPHKPLAPNDSKENKSRNRRVEIILRAN